MNKEYSLEFSQNLSFDFLLPRGESGSGQSQIIKFEYITRGLQLLKISRIANGLKFESFELERTRGRKAFINREVTKMIDGQLFIVMLGFFRNRKKLVCMCTDN